MLVPIWDAGLNSLCHSTGLGIDFHDESKPRLKKKAVKGQRFPLYGKAYLKSMILKVL